MTSKTRNIILVVLIALFIVLGWYLNKLKKEKAIFGGMSKRQFKKRIENAFKEYRFKIMREYLRWEPRPNNKLRVITVDGEPVVERIYGGSYVPVNESSPEPLMWVRDIKLKSLEENIPYNEQLEKDLNWLWDKEKPTPYNEFEDINYLYTWAYDNGVNVNNPEVSSYIQEIFKS
jgi:hypothetical protein